MDWISYVFTALLVVNLGVEIYLIVKKHKEDKAKYRFVVCKQDGKNLIPIDSFDCASDAHQHYVGLWPTFTHKAKTGKSGG